MSKRRDRLERMLIIRCLIGMMSFGAGFYVFIDDAMKNFTLFVVPAALVGIWLIAPYCRYYRRHPEKIAKHGRDGAVPDYMPPAPRYNPATGLPMVGRGADVAGNPYGMKVHRPK